MSREYVLERTQVVPVPIDEAFAFFADPRNLEQILGPLGEVVRRLLVRGWVDGIFDYRAGEVPRLLTPAPAAQPRRTA